MLVVGAAKGEDPSGAMMWTLAGFPLTTVAVPVWITGGKSLPQVVSMKENMHAPLCDAAMTLVITSYSIHYTKLYESSAGN